MQLTARVGVIAISAAALAASAGVARAEGERTVAIAPLSTLGAEARSKQTRAIEAALARAVGAVPGFATVSDKRLRRAIRRSKRAELKMCDGEVACLSELGGLVGTELVVYGELGGLGDAQVLALQVVDVAARRELRSTTAQFAGDGGDLDRALRAAAYRLLAPGLYKGALALTIDIAGASIFLDGDKVTGSPGHPLDVEVGNHALRVTHPEYRDYVRFVDIQFGETTALKIGMKAFPIVEDEMRQQGGARGPLDHGGKQPAATPWYHRWYTIAGASALVFIGSAVLVGTLSDGIDADREEIVGD